MKESKHSMTNILQRLTDLEKELSHIRQQLVQNMNEAAHQERDVRDYDVSYTLDDLYNAFGSKKHYAIRLKHSLQQKGINTLPEFLALTPGQLLELNNVGVGTLEMTKKALDRLGVQW